MGLYEKVVGDEYLEKEKRLQEEVNKVDLNSTNIEVLDKLETKLDDLYREEFDLASRIKTSQKNRLIAEMDEKDCDIDLGKLLLYTDIVTFFDAYIKSDVETVIAKFSALKDYYETDAESIVGNFPKLQIDYDLTGDESIAGKIERIITPSLHSDIMGKINARRLFRDLTFHKTRLELNLQTTDPTTDLSKSTRYEKLTNSELGKLKSVSKAILKYWKKYNIQISVKFTKSTRGNDAQLQKILNRMIIEQMILAHIAGMPEGFEEGDLVAYSYENINLATALIQIEDKRDIKAIDDQSFFLGVVKGCTDKEAIIDVMLETGSGIKVKSVKLDKYRYKSIRENVLGANTQKEIVIEINKRMREGDWIAPDILLDDIKYVIPAKNIMDLLHPTKPEIILYPYKAVGMQVNPLTWTPHKNTNI